MKTSFLKMNKFMIELDLDPDEDRAICDGLYCDTNSRTDCNDNSNKADKLDYNKNQNSKDHNSKDQDIESQYNHRDYDQNSEDQNIEDQKDEDQTLLPTLSSNFNFLC